MHTAGGFPVRLRCSELQPHVNSPNDEDIVFELYLTHRF